METTIKKQAIVQSISTMNASEMEKVIGFIKELSQAEQPDSSYLDFKRNALNQIQEALNPKSKAEAMA